MNKFVTITILLILVLAVPFTLLQLRKRQEIRQHATGGAVTFYFTRTTSTTPLTSLSLAPGQEVQLRLFLNAGTDLINGFDVTIAFGDAVELVSAVEGVGASRFNVQLFNLPDPQSRTFRFAKVSSDTQARILGTLHLATLAISASQTPATGAIELTSRTVTSPAFAQALNVPPATLPYTVAAPSATPTPSPSPSPTPSVSPTPTQSGQTLSLVLPLAAIGQGRQGGPQGPAKNANPRTPTRPVTLFLFDQNERLINPTTPIAGEVTFSPGDGLLRDTVTIPSSIPAGSYILKLKTPRYLVRRATGLVAIPPGGRQLQVPELTVGDIDGNNELDIQDYNIFQACFTRALCSANSRQNADLNDDGEVDILDYRFLLESFSTRRGD